MWTQYLFNLSYLYLKKMSLVSKSLITDQMYKSASCKSKANGVRLFYLLEKINKVILKHPFCLPNFKWYQGLSWMWSYGSWIYNYPCNQCLSPL